jgi:hypothetical protein
MLVKPDFTEVADEVTAGVYRDVITRGEVKEWPSGGHYVKWELQTVGETDPKNNGRKIFVSTSASGKGAFMLQRIYKAATGQALTGPFDTEQLVGKQVEVQLVTNDKGYSDVKAIRAVTT